MLNYKMQNTFSYIILIPLSTLISKKEDKKNAERMNPSEKVYLENKYALKKVETR